MAIIHKIPTVSNRLPPMAAVAAGSVIAMCAAATIAILGWLPSSAPWNAAPAATELPAISSAPQAEAVMTPVSAPAPAKKPRSGGTSSI